MTPKERQELSNAVMMLIFDLRLSKYHTIFLANMVLERIAHPTKTIDKLVSDVMKIMPDKIKNKQVVETSIKKSLEQLESELHDCEELEKISESEGKDFFSGNIVKNVVTYYVSKVTAMY